MIQYKSISVPFEKLQKEYAIARLTGDELYQKKGVKRDEILFGYSMQFDNGYEMTADMIAGEGAEKPAWRVLLLDSHGNEVDDSSEDYDATDTIFRCDDGATGDTYILKIKVMPCCIPIRYPVNEIYTKRVAYCDSQKLISELEARGYNVFDFVNTKNPYEFIPSKAFNECIVFIYDEDLKKPFSFPQKDGWKYAAFVQAMSNSNILDLLIDM